MLASFASCFQKVFPVEILEESAEPETCPPPKFIYRDETTSEKKSRSEQIRSEKPWLKVKDDDDEKKDTKMRVKVKMTKREAVLLLSRCKDGRILDFKDAARGLLNLPMNRITVISPCPATNSLLDSIPEEF